jgi:hypothetical protein
MAMKEGMEEEEERKKKVISELGRCRLRFGALGQHP